jgi:hypothetical protein
MPDDTHMDLRERVVAREQILVARDEGVQQECATRLTHPPPRWGRARVGVMARTDPW